MSFEAGKEIKLIIEEPNTLNTETLPLKLSQLQDLELMSCIAYMLSQEDCPGHIIGQYVSLQLVVLFYDVCKNLGIGRGERISKIEQNIKASVFISTSHGRICRKKPLGFDCS